MALMRFVLLEIMLHVIQLLSIREFQTWGMKIAGDMMMHDDKLFTSLQSFFFPRVFFDVFPKMTFHVKLL